MQLVGLLLYVLAQLAIGVWVSRRIKNETDFFVAGRTLGPVLATASIFATWFGAESCVGAAGSIYTDGVGAHSVEPFAYGLCLVIMGAVFAAPLWRRKLITLADLFHERFGPGVERLAALLLIPTSVLWAAAQVRAFGTVLTVASDAIDFETGLAIAAGVVVVYTVFGGLLADVYTDVVQGALLIIGLVVLAVVVWSEVGGANGVSDALARAGELRAGTASEPMNLLALLETWAIPIAGSVVAQEVVSRALAARSEGVARASGIAGGALYLLVGLVPVFIGLVGPALAPGLDDGEALLPHLAQEHLHGFLAVVFAGALVSAILSTADSALLVASSLVSRNLLERPTWSEKQRLVVARGGVLFFGLVAWWLAGRFESIGELLEHASAFASSGVLVIVCFGLFSKIGGAASATAALLLGAGVWIGGAAIGGFEAPYLASLAAALIGYLALSRR
jgi:SSS family transporter